MVCYSGVNEITNRKTIVTHDVTLVALKKVTSWRNFIDLRDGREQTLCWLLAVACQTDKPPTGEFRLPCQVRNGWTCWILVKSVLGSLKKALTHSLVLSPATRKACWNPICNQYDMWYGVTEVGRYWDGEMWLGVLLSSPVHLLFGIPPVHTFQVPIPVCSMPPIVGVWGLNSSGSVPWEEGEGMSLSSPWVMTVLSGSGAWY